MSSSPGDVPIETGPYLFRRVLAELPPPEDGDQTHIQVTCAQFWNGNLYLGTSTGELFHFVEIPSENDTENEQSAFIFASRRHPVEVDLANSTADSPGVQQILIIPDFGKACVRCNNTVVFYSLPELSPVHQSTRLGLCNWIGGVDLNVLDDVNGSEDGMVVMICQKALIRVVKISEKLQKLQDIRFGGCINVIRRGNIACVSDSLKYAIIDIVAQLQKPLFPISQLAQEQTNTSTGEIGEDSQKTSLGPSNGGNERTSTTSSARVSPDRAHGRSSSVGMIGQNNAELNTTNGTNQSGPSSGQEPEATAFPPRTTSLLPNTSNLSGPERSPSPATKSDSDTLGLSTEGEEARINEAKRLSQAKPFTPLIPHVASPTPSEFLLTTGTSSGEPGVGMFVGMDATPSSRGTLQFASYPESILLDGKPVDNSSSNTAGNDVEGGYVLAVVKDSRINSEGKTLEIQRWDVDQSEIGLKKTSIDISRITNENSATNTNYEPTVLLHSTTSPMAVPMPEIVRMLALLPMKLAKQTRFNERMNNTALEAVAPAERQAESSYIRQFSNIESSVLFSSGTQLWWAVRNPQLNRLENHLNQAMHINNESKAPIIDRQSAEYALNELRGQQPGSELQSFTLTYIRQKAALLLFMDLISQISAGATISEKDKRVTEEALKDAEIDPRFILYLLPILSEEINESSSGVWVMGGLKKIIEDFWEEQAHLKDINADLPADSGFLHLVKRYLQLWRRKKGLGSVPDGELVFRSVDAALLRLLLHMDKQTPPGPSQKGSVRSELHALVDHGVDCFDRAVELLEDAHRLYVLSRLYQHRRMSGQVLAVWRRILSGETDPGGELIDGEQSLRTYLTNISNPKLVEEYGTWLAIRNPTLGVRVFTEGTRVRFEPSQAVEIFREKAPGAVKDLLEHLVFDKNLPQHANDLISFYLDSVLSALDESDNARNALLDSYRAYRKLRPPKPTYIQFATSNAVDAEWWRNRLRLLQLLGGIHATASQYDVSNIQNRISNYGEELVPEMIVLHGRQGRHKEAIRLLTHGLGDFDTAVSYCVLGGSSTYSPVQGALPDESTPSRDEQVQLFRFLLEEFIRIENPDDRLNQTSQLLERFAGWFDVDHVLTLLPDSWSLQLISTFLESALRQLISERNETLVTRALTSTENLDINARFVNKMDSSVPKVEGVS